MELTVLVDNATLIDRYLLGEPGLSLLVEDGGTRVLFDAGYSDAFLVNAARLGVDLTRLDAVVLSHGHLDHTWGLEPLVRLFCEAAWAGREVRRPQLVAHPALFDHRDTEGVPELGSLLCPNRLSQHFELNASREPVWLSERLVFLGEIERGSGFEGCASVGRRMTAEGVVDDTVPDDSALAWRSDDGLVIVTGCSHSGICNIVEQARRVTGVERVRDIVGGLHLLAPPPEVMERTAAYLSGLGLEALHACHCTDLASKVALAARTPLAEVGSGLRLTYA